MPSPGKRARQDAMCAASTLGVLRGGTAHEQGSRRSLPPATPLVRLNIHALLHDSLRAVFGFPALGRVMHWLAPALLRMRGRLLRILPRRRIPRLRTRQTHPSYPAGYEIEGLGSDLARSQAQ